MTFGFSECFSDWSLRSARVSGEVEINDFAPQSTIAALNLTQQTGCFIFSNGTAGGDFAGLSPVGTQNETVALLLVGR